MEAETALLEVSHGGQEEISLQIIEPQSAESPDADDSYLMNRACRGKALIFTIDEIEEGDTDPRPNTDKDVEALVTTFKILGLRDDDIVVKKNSRFLEAKHNIKELSQANNTDVDCIIVTFLSLRAHYDMGEENQKFWDHFTSENCKSLAGKPKVFFIQAFRGRKLYAPRTVVRDRSCFGVCGYVLCGVVIGGVLFRVAVGAILGAAACGVLGHYLNGTTFSIAGTLIGFVMGGIAGAIFGDDGFMTEDPEAFAESDPKDTDFLVARSSPKDKVSPWDPEKGTWFIQRLCQNLQESAAASASGSGSGSGVDLMDAVKRAVDCIPSEDVVPEDPSLPKPVPTVTSTLTKRVLIPVSEPFIV